MNQDLEASLKGLSVLGKKRVLILRYEDLASKPQVSMKKLVNFLRVPLTTKLKRWVVTHTNPKSNLIYGNKLSHMKNGGDVSKSLFFNSVAFLRALC